MYSTRKLEGYYFKTRGFFILNLPIFVPFNKIYSLADSTGIKRTESFGPILEKAKIFGFGWIGIEVEKPIKFNKNVIYVNDEFEVYEYKGSYKYLPQAQKKIKDTHPRSKVVYNLFFDDPSKVKPENCRTHMFFKKS